MINEFKKFITRGSVIDLAVGVIIGGAFQKTINSLVNDIIMPLIGLASGGYNFNDRFIVLGGGSYPTLEAAKAAGAATFNYGEMPPVYLTDLK
ncbi:MAG: MscL family protein [Clostridiales bacterium]|nr:MscL family protein [Clostridiales bacterium]